MLAAALKYQEMNLSVIPVGKDKTPLVSWREFQDRRASKDEIVNWWTKNPDANVGIVTGEISGITVVDCDSAEAITAFRTNYKGETPTVKTPRGTHYYFKYEKGTRNTVKIGGLDLDLRSSGGYVVAPPSINKELLPYRWLKSFDSSALESLDFFSLYTEGDDTGENQSRQVSSKSSSVVKFFTEGRRDEDIFHAANCLIKGHAEPHFVRQTLEIIAQSCNPPELWE